MSCTCVTKSAVLIISRARYSQLPGDKEESNREQCELLMAFSKIACAGAQCLKSSGALPGTWKDNICAVCDAAGVQRVDKPKYWDADPGNKTWKDVMAGMLAIIEQERFEKSAKSRVLMAVAIGRVFNHLSSADYLSLSSSLGEWLLKTLTRSLREARIAAS